MKMPGARIVLEALKREGVDLIFGLPGGAVLPIYDVLYDFEGLRHILVRQEAAAGHAAEGYARTTGKVGVCLVTSGPAATNLVTALQDALMDSIPIVAFTGQVPTHLIGNDAFQEADNVGITRSCTKHNFLVKDGKDLGPIIREAFHIASTGRPGPVHVDLPKDVLVKEAEFVWPERVVLRSYNPNYDGHPGQIKRAARLMVRARRPVLYVGGGAISSDASAGTPGAGRADADSRHHHPDGSRRLSLGPPAVPGHAGHARQLLRQHGRAPLRRPDVRGRALRRSGHRQGRGLRPQRRRSSTSTSTPRRSART